MAESRGSLNIKSSDTSVLIRVRLISSTGLIITSGTASMYLLEFIPTTGAFKTLDWNDNTFKTTALTTPTVAMTHQTFANAAVNSGIWTYRITGSPLAALTVGNKYVAYVTHTSLVESIAIEFQYGDGEGDIAPYTQTITELAAVPGSAPAWFEALMFLYMKVRNQETSTASAATVAKSDNTIIGNATLSDDGTTFTKTKYT